MLEPAIDTKSSVSLSQTIIDLPYSTERRVHFCEASLTITSTKSERRPLIQTARYALRKMIEKEKTMDQYVTGVTIKRLREQRKMTQADLANRIAVSDKAVSKWETGKGYPDITLLEPLAQALGVSIAELISGNTIVNTNVSANISHCKFYVCPVCGNVITSTGEASICCHGVELMPLEAEQPDEQHAIITERVEDELFVYIEHPMSKRHFISFLAATSPNRVQLVKTYPESNAEARFKLDQISSLLAYCNKDGLFKINSIWNKG